MNGSVVGRAGRARATPLLLRKWAAVLAVAVLYVAATAARKSDDAAAVRTAVVTKGPLTLSVEVRGELEAERSVKVLRPRLYMGKDVRRGGSVKITKLIAEGADVKPGDLLVELDKSDLKDSLRKAESDVREKSADLEKAKKTLQVERERLRADVDKLKADLEIKGIARSLTESLPTTSDAVKVKTELETAVLIASLKQQDYDPMVKLHKSGHVTQQDLEIAELEWKQAQLDRQRKQLIHDLVMKGADECETERADMAVRLARILLEQAESKLGFETKKLEEDIRAAEADLEQAKFELKRCADSTEDADVKAPSAGTVVYARTWQGAGEEKIAEGAAIWTFHPLIFLPDLNSMVAKVYIEESQIQLIKEGQRAVIKLDAIRDMEFHGVVTEISNVTVDKSETRGQVSWVLGSTESSGIRVFEVKIRIDEKDKRIRPGLNGSVKVIVDEMQDVLSVPLDAVFKRDEQSIVYVKQGWRFVPRPITTGKTADGRVVVLEGVEAGEELSLAEPES